jgi:hypothetical protein
LISSRSGGGQQKGCQSEGEVVEFHRGCADTVGAAACPAAVSELVCVKT